MTDLPTPPPPDRWSAWVDVAGVAAAAVAITVRATLAEKPRPWRVVMLDAISTTALAIVSYHLVRGLGIAFGFYVVTELAFGLAVCGAVVGWATLLRMLRRRMGDSL